MKDWPTILFLIFWFLALIVCFSRGVKKPAKKCEYKGYQLIGNGHAVTNCGDTIRKTPYKVYGDY